MLTRAERQRGGYRVERCSQVFEPIDACIEEDVRRLAHAGVVFLQGPVSRRHVHPRLGRGAQLSQEKERVFGALCVRLGETRGAVGSGGEVEEGDENDRSEKRADVRAARHLDATSVDSQGGAVTSTLAAKPGSDVGFVCFATRLFGFCASKEVVERRHLSHGGVCLSVSEKIGEGASDVVRGAFTSGDGVKFAQGVVIPVYAKLVFYFSEEDFSRIGTRETVDATTERLEEFLLFHRRLFFYKAYFCE